MPSATVLATMRTTLFLQNTAHQYINGRLLDAGCGSMPYKRLLSPLTTEWVGLDARPVGDIEAYMEENGQPDESFDTVLCTDALQYCPDPQIAVAELARVLKVGGHLILTTPNTRADDGTARWSFPLGGLKELTTRAGLVPVEVTAIHGLFSDEYEAFLAWGKYGIPAPKEIRGLFESLDKRFPLLSAVIARKEVPE
jgi:SAM-dependent methyltransferase